MTKAETKARAEPRKNVKKRGILGRILRGLGVLLLCGLGYLLIDGWQGFGHRATGARRARMERSPQWKNGRFVNPQPLINDWLGVFSGRMHISEYATPKTPLPVAAVSPQALAAMPPSGLRLTWFGHSSTLIEIDGARVLTDPVWGSIVGPFSRLGPHPYFPPPIALADLPPLDAVVISHDHFDHLDHRTIIAMRNFNTRFVVPLGVGAHLEYWGVPPDHIIELDWWERTKVGSLEIVCTPARHASGRMLIDDDAKLWAGYAFLSDKHRIYYSGDTGLFPAMRDIGERLGPFDVALIETGQYHRAWPDWHIGPEQAVLASKLVRGRLMFPVHWARLTLAYHGWTEPIERVLAAAKATGVTVIAPRPGESVEPDLQPNLAPWWPTLPFESATQHPIVSSGN